MRRTTTLLTALGVALSGLALAAAPALAQSGAATVEPLNYQPYMNVFRRYDTEDEDALFAFYTDAIGLNRLETFGAVHRFDLDGETQYKLTRRTPDRSYVDGDFRDATGLRLITFHYPDADAVTEAFTSHGYPAPSFQSAGGGRSAALVQDPDGNWIELLAAPGEDEDFYKGIEVGLVVSNIGASEDFYRSFVGLTPLDPVYDSILQTTLHPFKHGTTTVNLMTYGALPADTGSGGIQYVISDVEAVDRMAQARHVTVEQPLSDVSGFQLRTIWLDDPDGITNYFAQVGRQPGVAPAAAGN